MKNLTLILLLVSFIVSSCSSQDCNDLPSQFSSYSEAVNEVKSTNFSFEDNANTYRSSVIENADFFSCNGELGYLLIEL